MNQQIKKAAAMFIESRDAKAIALAIDRTERTVYRLLDRDDFHACLDALGYDGERSFRVVPRTAPRPKTQREPSIEKKRARQLWLELKDIPERNRTRAIAEQMGLNLPRVRKWTKDWKKGNTGDKTR